MADGNLAELDAPDATTRVLGDADRGIEELNVHSVASSKLMYLALALYGWALGRTVGLGVTTRLWLLRDPA